MQNITFNLAVKTLPQEGNLVYEYNPFRNYRLSESKYYYNNKFYSENELLKELNSKYPDLKSIKDLANNLDEIDEKPILYEKGSLVDFETEDFEFDIHNPVDIIPQYSYDGSVNLIINDGKNSPKLINSRFSPIGRNKYKIVDRKGDNDTNIYDEGSQFNIDTSLYKNTIEIPSLTFNGVLYGGQMSIGNYHFYFRYVDADGNETDFVAESGLVSIFIGNTPNSITSGFRKENSNKLVSFTLSNIDTAYQYIKVYYTVNTSDIYENNTTSAYRIEDKFVVNSLQKCNIVITGFEQITQVPLDEINPRYQIYGSVNSQESCKNRLFFANVTQAEIPYKDLTDISLRFLPKIVTESYDSDINENYNIYKNLGYYDPNYIYNKTGYWYDEMYRLGIVYIFSNNTLSPVFNVRGGKLESGNKQWSNFTFKEDRQYINWNDETFNIVSENNQSSIYLENAKGVIYIDRSLIQSKNQIIGINFDVDPEVLDYIKNDLHIKGFFFVRQKRIPTTLCQAFTIGIDSESHTPVIPYDNKYITETFLTKEKRLLENDFNSRQYEINKSDISTYAAICPEYDINSPYYNSLFNGSEFRVIESLESYNNNLTQDIYNNRHFYVKQNESTLTQNSNYYITNIIGVEDNTKLVAIGDTFFSARAGEAEEAFRYEYITQKKKSENADNLLRGSYGPYLGIEGYNSAGKLIDIKIPGFSTTNLPEYFKIRYNDNAPYYAISDRFSTYDLTKVFNNSINNNQQLIYPLYRGDCYICQFTHRLNRNFQDPSAPTNDSIVDRKCWVNNYKVEDGIVNKEAFESINLGDVNAVQLGMWITFTVRSSYNLCIRGLDSSLPDEEALFGHVRGFYPYHSMNVNGAFKLPEAQCYNQGFTKGLSEKYNFEVPDVPYLKDTFSTRIAYSDIQINGAFQNNFRVFPGQNYRDYPQTYGSITKIIELRGHLICVYEHGIDFIPIQERTLAGEGTGGNVYINTSNVLPETTKNISDTFGSQWKDSIIKTPKGIYGVDTIGKKIWRTNGESFECISDFRIQEFLNNNISLTERELDPIIGIRNVKTHYNKFKGDVMFTFYDNLYGFEEKVWNICFNENLEKWITFYSWVPSQSENIYNQFFSFDRNTSKWISKLGISNSESSFANGITLSNNTIEKNTEWKAELKLENRNLPNGVDYNITYTLERDNYGNYKLFKDPYKENNKWYLELADDVIYDQLCSEFYAKKYINGDTVYILDNPNSDDKTSLVEGSDDRRNLPNNKTQKEIYSRSLDIYKDEQGRRINLSYDNRINGDKPVILLNIKAKIEIIYSGENETLKEAYKQGFTNSVNVDLGHYESVVAIIPKYNEQFLTTDFWKHGQAGIIDIADEIRPTYWYGKQHPFEFEFVVADNPDKHKIFDNLQIISNKAEPESFHYEIIGECYDFAKDKKNMYIRQEATKEMYQYNGSDIVFDHDYKLLKATPRSIKSSNELNKVYYDKSTMFPLYYSRRDTINEIEDYYHLYGYMNEYNKNNKNFSALSGSEIVRYKNLDEYRIQNHTKAVKISDYGILRGNMQYKEDLWDVQINPINFVQKNEKQTEWINNQPPIVYNLFPLPKDIENINSLKIPSSDQRVTTWNTNLDSVNKQAKLKDKFIKIRIRYSGKDLAIISAIRTLYSISYA